MNTLKNFALFLFNSYLKIINWLKNHTKILIGGIALIIWCVIYLFGATFGIESYPIGYFQKIFFGIISMSAIEGVGLIWLRNTQHYYFDLLDNGTENGINNLTEWEKIKVGLFYYGLYVGGIVLLASLY